MLKNNKGFSLVELIIVIVILAILVGIGVPNLMAYVKKANVASDKANAEIILRNAIAASATYAATNPGEELEDTALTTAVTNLIQGKQFPTPKAVKGSFVLEAEGDGADRYFTVSVRGEGADADEVIVTSTNPDNKPQDPYDAL